MRVQSQFIEMFGDVEKKPFVDVCISKGEYGSNSPADDYDGNIRYVRITDITEEGNLNGIMVSPRKVEEKYMLLQDDLLFARTGNTVGKTYLHKSGRMIFAGYLIRYRLNKKLMLPQFAFAYTHTNQYYDWVEKIKKVGAQPNISAAQYDSMPIPVPSMAKQIEFVAITKQADKSKFVGFKSQFIEMFGNHSSTPVSHYIADSYPGEWGMEDKDGSGVKVIRTTNFTNAGKLDLTDVVTRSIIEKKVKRKTIKKFDTILERSGGTAENPVGRVVLFEEDDQYLCNNFTQVLRFKDIDPRYAFYSLFYYYQMNKTYVRSMGSKTTGIQNLDMNKYLEIGIPNASDDEQSLFIAITEQADKSKFELRKSIDTIDQVIKSVING